jgi:hypothetical protein
MPLHSHGKDLRPLDAEGLHDAIGRMGFGNEPWCEVPDALMMQ